MSQYTNYISNFFTFFRVNNFYTIFVPFRSIILWIIFGLSIVVLYFFIVLLKPLVNHLYSSWIVMHLWGRFIIFISRISVITEGEENFVKDKANLFLANHQSMFDIPILHSIVPSSFIFFSKASLRKIPFLGAIMRSLDSIFVERENKKQASKAIYTMVQKISKENISVAFFPEGTRSFPDGSMRPFKKGAFLMAIRHKIPLQPISIQGSIKIIPMQKDKKIKNIYSRKIYVKIHPRINPEEYENLTEEELNEKVWQIIANDLDGNKGEKKIKMQRSPRSSEDRAVVS